MEALADREAALAACDGPAEDPYAADLD